MVVDQSTKLSEVQVSQCGQFFAYNCPNLQRSEMKVHCSLYSQDLFTTMMGVVRANYCKNQTLKLSPHS